MSATLPRRPDFIIIGAMKSATSTLHMQLARQQGFWMSKPKEPNFFSDDPVWAKGLDWYASLFAGAAPGDLKGESSTHYTKMPDYPQCLDRMRNHVANAKLIYIMRHPIDRLVSHYMHGWLESSMKGSINEAIDRYPALINYGQYAMQIRPFLESYGPDRILPVFFERLTHSPQEELNRVCQFLGYSGTPVWDEQEAKQNVSAERLRASALRDAFVKAPLLSTIRKTLVPQSVRDRIKQFWQMDEKPTLSGSALSTLKRRFDADLAKLGPWLGTTLDCDSFKPTVVEQPFTWSELAPRP